MSNLFTGHMGTDILKVPSATIHKLSPFPVITQDN
jgi:hypothetical protein